MSEFVTVARHGDIPEGEGRPFTIGGKLIAVFFSNGQYYALDDVCPHMGAQLSGGWVENGAVICPWHAWRFSVEDGRWLDSPKSRLKCGCYEVRREGDAIQVRVPDDAGSSDGASPA
jgi:nitrite reductase (NADH) small subunit/3-phenylpropionate/trans-cinnamate dioxygenase ferredoxin subunit